MTTRTLLLTSGVLMLPKQAKASQSLRLSSGVNGDGIQMEGDTLTCAILQHGGYMVIRSNMKLVGDSYVPLITEERKWQAQVTSTKVIVENQKYILKVMKGTFSFCPVSQHLVPKPKLRWSEGRSGMQLTLSLKASNSDFLSNSPMPSNTFISSILSYFFQLFSVQVFVCYKLLHHNSFLLNLIFSFHKNLLFHISSNFTKNCSSYVLKILPTVTFKVNLVLQDIWNAWYMKQFLLW